MRDGACGSAAPWRRVVLAVALLVVPAACGDDGSEPSAVPAEVDPSGSIERSSDSSPFTVGEVPGGFELVAAGRGPGTRQAWGDEASGESDEPFTVLAPAGSSDGPGEIVVSIAGFEGLGGLIGASRGYDAAQPFTTDGRDAVFASLDDRSEVLVARGRDIAVRVTAGPGIDRERLVRIADAAEVSDDHTWAPVLSEPPDGLEVVGSVQFEGLAGFGAAAGLTGSGTYGQLGGDRAHGARWLAADGTVLTVVAVPSTSLSIEALGSVVHLAPWSGWEATTIMVAGRSGLSVEPGPDLADMPGARRWLAVETGWGDVLLVGAAGGTDAQQPDLAAVAASVEVADQEGWDTLVSGPTELRADAGRAELARGTAGGQTWLLQSAPRDGLAGIYIAGQPEGVDLGTGVDPCLKLGRLRRVCAGAGSSGGYDASGLATSATSPGADAELHGLPPFVLVTTSDRGEKVRVTAGDGQVFIGDLVAVDGGRRWAAVVFVEERAAMSVCVAPPPDAPTDVVTQRVEVLDETGTVSHCIGVGG
ncbi:MAG: hypothetical protein KA758_12215 [Acidimicrobiales bacterium]|nr:hypothetical protein [Acidimicrobiales bacterium]